LREQSRTGDELLGAFRQHAHDKIALFERRESHANGDVEPFGEDIDGTAQTFEMHDDPWIPRLKPDTYADLYAKRQVVIGTPRVGNRHDDDSPDDVLSPIEKARRWYSTKFDKAPCRLSDKALSRFIVAHNDEAVVAGVAFVPSSGSLRRWVNERGEPNRRPTGAIRSKTGKVPRRARFPEFVERALDRLVAWYWAEEGRDKTEAYAQLAGVIKTANRLGRAKLGPAWVHLPTPSYETVRNRIRQAEDRTTWTAKYGGRRAKLRFAGTAPTLEASKILETVVIDATVVDGCCVWNEDTMLPLGRPTLYIAIDVRSRQVIAWLLTFEPPSLYGVMALLEKIVTPNADGVWGKPDEIVVDCGWEFVSPSWQEACESAGISVHWAPIRTPEYKAIVERMFRTINLLVFRKLLGGSVRFPPHLMSRFGLKPSETASITINKLDELLHYTLRIRYANRKHRGIGEAPQLVWEREALKRRQIVDDLPALLAHIGQSEVCTLTNEGVVTKDGLRFYDRKAVSRLLNDLSQETPVDPATQHGSATSRVKVVINPADISKAMVWNHRRRRPEWLENVQIRFAIECGSRWEYRMVKESMKKADQEFITEDLRLAHIRKLRAKIESASPDLKGNALARQRALLAARKDKPEGDTVVFAKAPATWHGLATVDATASDIPTTVAAKTRKDDGLPPAGVRRGGKKAIGKQKRTMAKKREAEAADAAPATMMLEPTKFLPAPNQTLSNEDLAELQGLDWVNAGKEDQ